MIQEDAGRKSNYSHSSGYWNGTIKVDVNCSFYQNQMINYKGFGMGVTDIKT
jgi:hypothetical protein